MAPQEGSSLEKKKEVMYVEAQLYPKETQHRISTSSAHRNEGRKNNLSFCLLELFDAASQPDVNS